MFVESLDLSTFKFQLKASEEGRPAYIKRQWGFSYICTKKGLKRASADVGLRFTALNLRRLMNIVDKNVLKQYFKELADLCFVGTASYKPNSALVTQPTFSFTYFQAQKRLPHRVSKSLYNCVVLITTLVFRQTDVSRN